MKTLQERIDELETPAKFYLQNLYDALAEAIVIPNEMLPEDCTAIQKIRHRINWI